MTDTAPKTPDSAEASELVREMADAWQRIYDRSLSRDAAMQAAARVLLERMDESFKNRMVEKMLHAFKTEYRLGASTRDRDRVKAAAQEFLRTFRDEHGLSAEDET